MSLLGGTASFAGGRPLVGRARVPGDKSISHRALILAALAEGRSRLTGLSDGADVRCSLAAIAALGAGAAVERGAVVVDGGRERLREAGEPLDLGNSGTGMRLLAGLAASLPFLTVLLGDESLRSRPMGRVTAPLRAMGASIDGRAEGELAPLVVRGGALHGIEHVPPVASAQVKGAILLAGIGASGETVVQEARATRRHTEELLALAGAPPRVVEDRDGYRVSVSASALSPFELDVPGDPSQAAFLVVAACLVPGSEVVVENVYVGPGRAGFLAVLERMGAQVELCPRGPQTADLAVRSTQLSATEVAPREIPELIDELPVLAVAAAYAKGETTITGAAELRAKESDRIATMASELSKLGATVEELPDGLVVHGAGAAGPMALALPSAAKAEVLSHGDHRVAMALAVAGLAAGDGRAVEVTGMDAVATSWPAFAATLGSLQGDRR